MRAIKIYDLVHLKILETTMQRVDGNEKGPYFAVFGDNTPVTGLVMRFLEKKGVVNKVSNYGSASFLTNDFDDLDAIAESHIELFGGEKIQIPRHSAIEYSPKTSLGRLDEMLIHYESLDIHEEDGE